MTTVDVLIPYRPSTPLRVRAYEIVRSYYADLFPDWNVIVCDDPTGGAFACGRAINAALSQARADVVVYQDADSLVHWPQLTRAVTAAADARPVMVKAFTDYRRLSAAWRPTHWRDVMHPPDEYVEWRQSPVCAMGVTAVDRKAWRKIGGFDPRFDGWGYDDIALETLAGATIGIDRIDGPLYHMHHERREEEAPESPTLVANEALNRRYDAEAGNAGGLVALRREAPWPE